MMTRSMVSLFSGIGGFEAAAKPLGIETTLACEIDPAAQAVLRKRFPKTELVSDIRDISVLADKAPWLVTAGFPCQDLSSVGQKAGIRGANSSLVDEVFRLLRDTDPDWLVLENVMFMLHVDKGAAMRHVISGLENLGFNWAYRLLDSSEFGLPQRRRRVYFVASRKYCAAATMFPDRAIKRSHGVGVPAHMPSYGFYWTEGTYATGITMNGVPPLKTGSTIGIPSPPAILHKNGQVGTPTIEDAERLQGFRAGWTRPATAVERESVRWRLVGNAVSVPVAREVLRRLVQSEEIGKVDALNPQPIKGKWPSAAYGYSGKRMAIDYSWFPGMRKHPPIDRFLKDPLKPLSLKATKGFLKRARKGNLKFPDGFLTYLDLHASTME